MGITILITNTGKICLLLSFYVCFNVLRIDFLKFFLDMKVIDGIFKILHGEHNLITSWEYNEDGADGVNDDIELLGLGDADSEGRLSDISRCRSFNGNRDRWFNE